MFDDLNSIFYNQLVIKCDEFRKLRKSRVVGNDRLVIAAIECATALFHFREHIPDADKKSRSNVEADCPDYRLVADVSNASKHGSLTRPTPEGSPLVSSAQDIQELVILTEFEDDEGTYTDCEAVVNVVCSDGVTRCLDDAILSTLNYWGNELNRMGVRKFKPFEYQPYPGTRFVAREDAMSVNFVVTQGVRFQVRHQFLKFDAKLGYATPVDLTGAEVEFRISRPAHTLELTVTLPDRSETVSVSINLNDDQSQRYLRIGTEEERQVFYQEILEAEREQINAKLVDALKAQSDISSLHTDVDE